MTHYFAGQFKNSHYFYRCQSYWKKPHLLQSSGELWFTAWLYLALFKLSLTSVHLSAFMEYFSSLEKQVKNIFVCMLLFFLHNWAQNECNMLPMDRKMMWTLVLKWRQHNTRVWQSVKTQVTCHTDAAFISRLRLTFPKLFRVYNIVIFSLLYFKLHHFYCLWKFTLL